MLSSCTRETKIEVIYNNEILPGKSANAQNRNSSADSIDNAEKAKNNQTDESDISSSDESVDASSRVYITPSGKKYHFNSGCAGKNSVETTLAEALNKNLTPCKKCVKQ
ncbi:MAG: hypothetical protein J6B23_05735 [Clostridia bacterium]|nr:hypothetical protein [Clostridia bacterium]